MNSDEDFSEHAAVFSDADFLGDLYAQSTADDALNVRSKFVPKAKNKGPSKPPGVVLANFSPDKSGLASSPASLAGDANASLTDDASMDADGSNLKVEDPTSPLSLEVKEDSSFNHSFPLDPSLLVDQDSEHGFPESEALLPENNIISARGNEILDGEEAVDFSTFSSLDDTFTQPLSDLACSSGKFRPKPSSRRKDQQPECVPSARGSFQPDTEPPECPNQTIRSQIYVDSSTGEQGYLTQPKHATADSQALVPVQDVGENVVPKSAEEAPRSSSRLRNKVQFNMLANDVYEEDACNGQSGNVSSLIDAENQMDYCNDSQYTQETRIHQQTSRNTKKSVTVTEKSSRKRTPGSEEHAPAKRKFAHSTRRTRRKVDKKLLELPENEIDVRKLPLKDLILLSEARERMSVKAGITEQPQDNRRHHDFDYDHYNEGHAYMDENEYNIDDEEAIPEAKVSSIKLNYHTYMNRPRSSRWTKMETEMFYQAIRQFGTDFSMIQQLFPGRTRHQVRLKFKNEERKHPLQIADAITHPSKDYSHFEEVIQRVRAQAEEEARKQREMEGPESESQDATGVNEETDMKISDGEEQGADEMDGYNPAKYDDYQDAFDWDDFTNTHGQSPYMGKDDFDDTYY